ncbi:hypothetical protein ABK040_002478 [Willaertia magna]
MFNLNTNVRRRSGRSNYSKYNLLNSSITTNHKLLFQKLDNNFILMEIFSFLSIVDLWINPITNSNGIIELKSLKFVNSKFNEILSSELFCSFYLMNTLNYYNQENSSHLSNYLKLNKFTNKEYLMKRTIEIVNSHHCSYLYDVYKAQNYMSRINMEEVVEIYKQIRKRNELIKIVSLKMNNYLQQDYKNNSILLKHWKLFKLVTNTNFNYFPCHFTYLEKHIKIYRDDGIPIYLTFKTKTNAVEFELYYNYKLTILINFYEIKLIDNTLFKDFNCLNNLKLQQLLKHFIYEYLFENDTLKYWDI